jgi:hypothetical protein
MTEMSFERLRKVFSDNEPELVLLAYLPGHEAHFQLLDCDSCRIGTMICTGVRSLCIGTAFEAYERLDVYTSTNLLAEMAWMVEALVQDRQWIFLVMPTKTQADGTTYSTLPRISGRPTGFIICEDVTYREEDTPGFG